jgi:guanosine-3',5'-bis(diphosphate) 3'-pyrophosphohydrolase
MTSDPRSDCSSSVLRILAAARFAAERHAYQKRKGASQEPYINHLIEVAELIASSSSQLDPGLVSAGFLHDTIEDTATTLAELEERFGSDVASLVAEVTDDKSLPKETRKDLQVTNAYKKSERAQTLKLADKISNLRSLLVSPPVGWSLERKRQYFEWAKAVVSGFNSPNPKLKKEFDHVYSMGSQLTET